MAGFCINFLGIPWCRLLESRWFNPTDRFDILLSYLFMFWWLILYFMLWFKWSVCEATKNRHQMTNFMDKVVEERFEYNESACMISLCVCACVLFFSFCVSFLFSYPMLLFVLVISCGEFFKLTLFTTVFQKHS